MAKRIQKKVKHFRGEKREVKQAANDWMAGASGHNNVIAKQPRIEPAFQNVDVPPEDAKLAAVQSDDAEDGGEEEECTYDLMESEEEGGPVIEAQLVTPSAKQPPDVETPTSIQQYQAIIRNYQAQLERAERQIRAISKTSLADKFLENEVRKYVKEGLWKRCKFITCRETMEECMNEVANQFAIEDKKREHWKSTYEHAVRDALNNRRNNTAQDLKKELIGRWDLVHHIETLPPCPNHNLFHDYLALRKEYPGIYENPAIFTNVRACDSTANFQPFWLFFDRLIASVAGKKIWTNRDKVGQPITKGNKISIVDEAFTILAIQNYWPKWFSEHGLKEPAKWTDSRQGNSQYMGWHEDAYTRFDLICRRIQQQRSSLHSKQLEQRFQQKALEEYATMRGGSRARARLQEPTVKVFNELNNVAAV